MGYQFHEYKINMTDNGPVVEIFSPFKVKDVPLPPAVLMLPYGMSRTKVIRHMKTLDYSIETIVDHEPIVTDFHKFFNIDQEEIGPGQIIRDGDEWLLDDFGMHVYAYSFLTSEKGQLKDLRYD